jgi:hypothetical protein
MIHRAALTLGLLAGIYASAQAADLAPQALIADLYKQDHLEKGPFFQTKSRDLVDRYFTPRTARLIWDDAVAAAGEVGALDSNPLYDGQDNDVKGLQMTPITSKNGKSEVAATFANRGRKVKIKFLLSLTPSGWRIDDIRYADGRSLLSIYGGNENP